MASGKKTSEFYLMILSTAKVVLCLKSTYPQAPSRCSKRPVCAQKVHLPTFPTSVPLTGKSSSEQACYRATPTPKTCRQARSYAGGGNGGKTLPCVFLLPERVAKGQRRVVPQPLCPRTRSSREQKGSYTILYSESSS